MSEGKYESVSGISIKIWNWLTILHAPCGEARLAANPTAIVAWLATTASFIESEAHPFPFETIMKPSFHTLQVFVVFVAQNFQFLTSQVSTIKREDGFLKRIWAKISFNWKFIACWWTNCIFWNTKWSTWLYIYPIKYCAIQCLGNSCYTFPLYYFTG